MIVIRKFSVRSARHVAADLGSAIQDGGGARFSASLAQFSPVRREYVLGMVVRLSETCVLASVLNSHGPQTTEEASSLLIPAGCQPAPLGWPASSTIRILTFLSSRPTGSSNKTWSCPSVRVNSNSGVSSAQRIVHLIHSEHAAAIRDPKLATADPTAASAAAFMTINVAGGVQMGGEAAPHP